MISNLDWTIIVLYMLVVVGIGVAAGFFRRKGSEGGHYFLADQSLTWPIIGLAMFAANISTVHLVSLAQCAYTSGLLYGNFEWMAGFTLILLSLFFAPLYLRSRVPTLPDYLERRYNRNCRDALSFVSLISAIVIHIGVALFTAAAVLCFIFNIPEAQDHLRHQRADVLHHRARRVDRHLYHDRRDCWRWCGRKACRRCCCWRCNLHHRRWVPCGRRLGCDGPDAGHASASAGRAKEEAFTVRRQSSCTWRTRSTRDPSAACRGIRCCSAIRCIGIWYWCCDQTIVQRVLAAKDEKQARLGPLFCAFIKILPVFFFVLPGVICVALVQQGAFNGDGAGTSADTYTFMITHLLPVGLERPGRRGHAGGGDADLLGGAELRGDAVRVRICQTLEPRDDGPPAGRHRQVTTVVATVIAIVLSPMFGHYDTIFAGHQQAHLLHRAADHGGVPLRRLLETRRGRGGVHHDDRRGRDRARSGSSWISSRPQASSRKKRSPARRRGVSCTTCASTTSCSRRSASSASASSSRSSRRC